MTEERRYFCCTDNLTGCKILGAIQLFFSFIALILVIVDIVVFGENPDKGEATLVTTTWVTLLVLLFLTGLWLLVPIMLIFGAIKRNPCLMMTYLILNGLSIVGHAYGIFRAIREISVVAIFGQFMGLGIALWATLVAGGGYQEVKNSVHSG